jgi:molybdenum cofactor cytidylyltransferase
MTGAILLAAGASQRMGTQKLLLPWAGHTVIGHIVDQLLHSQIDRIVVVTGHDPAALHQVLDGQPIDWMDNPDYSQGMITSVRCGIQTLPAHCDTILVALGDQPRLTTALIDELIKTFHQSDKGILLPCYAGRRGHPLLFARQYAQEIFTQYDDTGLRGLLHAHPEAVYEHNVSDASVLSDMDYPEDYQRELEKR